MDQDAGSISKALSIVRRVVSFLLTVEFPSGAAIGVEECLRNV